MHYRSSAGTIIDDQVRIVSQAESGENSKNPEIFNALPSKWTPTV